MTMVKSLAGKAGLSLLAACTVCITALFFSAGLVYYTNIHEYSIPFSAFLEGMAEISWPILLVLAIVLLVLPKKYAIFQRGIAAMVLVAVGAYLYSSFILWQYGVLDGKDIDWSAYWWRGIVDIVVALAFLFILYKYWRKLYDYAGRIFLCLLVIQFATLASYHFTGDASTNVAQSKYVDISYSTDFSEKENIIFIVIDTLPYDIFEIIMQEKKYSDYFKSFVSFTDCAAGFPTTIASIGLMLTGKYYDNSVSLKEYYSSALSSPGSLPEFCKQNDYIMTFSSGVASRFNKSFAEYASNTRTKYVLTGQDLMTLAAAALFRSTPHLFKRFFVDFEIFAAWTPITQNTAPTTSVLQNDELKIPIPQNYMAVWDFSFLDKIQNVQFTKAYKKPAFNFIHLRGFHRPHNVDENFVLHENKIQPIEHAKACLNLVNIFLNKLRTYGLFENSTIIITSDHTEKSSENAAHIPLVIKPRNAQNNAMKNIEIPVSLADVPSIAVQLAKEPTFNLIHFKPQEKRYFNFYQWGGTWATDFLPTITRYEIDGPAKDSDSYIKRAVFSPGFEAISLADPVNVDFVNNRKEFEQFIVGRFNFDPVVGLLAIGRNDLAFSFKDLSTSHIIMTTNFVGEKDKEARVTISYKLIRSGKHYRKSFALSEPIIIPAVNEIWVRFSNIESLASITFEPFDKLKIALGDEYPLSQEDVYDLLIASGSGFSSRGKRGVMTEGDSALLVIPWKTAPVKPVVMILKVNHIFVNAKIPVQRASAYAGDTLIASKEFTKNAAQQWMIELDPRHFTSDKEWAIRFDLPDSAIPKNLGIGTDSRSIALRFESVRFLDAADAVFAEEPHPDEIKPTVTMGAEYALSQKDAYDLLIAGSSGFSTRGKRGVLTDGDSASLVIPWQTAPIKPVVMVLKINHVFVNAKVPLQRASVYAGDTLIALKEFTKNAAQQWMIELDPRHFANDKKWTIRFDLPDSAIPKNLGIGTDSRSMALRFESVQFLDAADAVFAEEPHPDEIKPTVTMGAEYALSQKDAYDLLIAGGSGFASRGNRGVLTNGDSASLVIPWQIAPIKPVVMVLKINHIFVNAKVPLQRASVYAGDTLIASKEFTKNAAQQWMIELDPRHFANDKKWTIRFDLPDSAIPKNLGIGTDSRSMALRFESVQFLDAADAVFAEEPHPDEIKPTVAMDEDE